ncbi:hypothetical protein PoB_000056800 [Plakobranchus ocellatus]|uniref:Apple domain-containing protein n=1 Tax=Plakobranchus ocellatus TaxID=259542 RepID=A0AAV3XVP7_9GAST|nr:hypothetical protein PoB_000056800 [Plakobranchus ocellatus]
MPATFFFPCLSDKRQVSEGYGRTAEGQQPAGNSSILLMTTTLSYLECILLCSQDHNCRTASFHLHQLTCTMFGPDSYTHLIPDLESKTFIRQGYT